MAVGQTDTLGGIVQWSMVSFETQQIMQRGLDREATSDFEIHSMGFLIQAESKTVFEKPDVIGVGLKRCTQE